MNFLYYDFQQLTKLRESHGSGNLRPSSKDYWVQVLDRAKLCSSHQGGLRIWVTSDVELRSARRSHLLTQVCVLTSIISNLNNLPKNWMTSLYPRIQLHLRASAKKHIFISKKVFTYPSVLGVHPCGQITIIQLSIFWPIEVVRRRVWLCGRTFHGCSKAKIQIWPKKLCRFFNPGGHPKFKIMFTAKRSANWKHWGTSAHGRLPVKRGILHWSIKSNKR